MRTDYDYIITNDANGILQKHSKYINHYAKSMAYYSDLEDVKQDLYCEVLDLIDWINPKKINEDFNIKTFIFQKCNAYRKSKKHRIKAKNFENYSLDFFTISENNMKFDASEKYCANSEGLDINLLDKKNINIQKEYEVKHDFPENVLTTDLDRKIYFMYFVDGDKKKTICADLGITYGKLQERIYVIENKYSKY